MRIIVQIPVAFPGNVLIWAVAYNEGEEGLADYLILESWDCGISWLCNSDAATYADGLNFIASWILGQMGG